MNLNIDELNISDASLEQTLKRQYYIAFKIDESGYYLSLRLINGVYRADTIWHKITHTCHLCEQPFSCNILDDYKDDIFKRLITFPSIRLEWLFMNHS